MGCLTGNPHSSALMSPWSGHVSVPKLTHCSALRIGVSMSRSHTTNVQVLRMKDDIVQESESYRLMMFASFGSTTKHLKPRYDDAVVSGTIDVASPAEFQMLNSLLIAIRTVIIETGRHIEGSVNLIQQLVSQLSH
jgi:hypothetical protein